MNIVDILVEVFSYLVEWVKPRGKSKFPIRKLGLGLTTALFLVFLFYLLTYILNGKIEAAIVMVIQFVLSVLLYETILLIFYVPLRKKCYSYHLVMLWQWVGLVVLQPKKGFIDWIQSMYISDKAFYTVVILWLLGAIVRFSIDVIRHKRLLVKLNEGSLSNLDEKTKKIFENILLEVSTQYDTQISGINIKKTMGIKTPIAVGALKPTIYLPLNEYSDLELEYVFRHELVHIVNADNDIKVLISFINALLWFLPFMKRVTKLVAEDIELACDEVVLDEKGENERKLYANLILNQQAEMNGFSTCLSASAESLKYRLNRIISPKIHGKLLGIVANIIGLSLSIGLSEIFLLLL